MTRILGIAGFVTVFLLSAGEFGRLQAQRYSPYCAQFSDGSGMDCSYPSLQSCLAAVNGVGGICAVNPRSPNQPPPPPGLLQRLLQGNGPAFAPINVGPPPDSGRLRNGATRHPLGRNAQYCAVYSDGSTNCGFPTLASCRLAVSGAGGSCNVNPRASHAMPKRPGS